MYEQVQCDCGECEFVQVCTEQANAGKCLYCWDEFLLEEARQAQLKQK